MINLASRTRELLYVKAGGLMGVTTSISSDRKGFGGIGNNACLIGHKFRESISRNHAPEEAFFNNSSMPSIRASQEERDARKVA